MRGLWGLLRPTMPQVALLLEPPFVSGVRVDRLGRHGAPLVTYESPFSKDPGDVMPFEAFSEIAEASLLRLGSPKRMSVVVGDAFFKSQILDISDFPKREAERLQVLRWHVRKNLDYPVEAARIHYMVLRRTPSSWSLWVSAAREDEVKALEGAFLAKGCQIGYIGLSTLELLDLAKQRDMVSTQGATLVLNRSGSTLTFLFAEQGVPLFYRSKELPPEREPASHAERLSQEIRLTLAYFRERFGSSPLRRILLRAVPGDAPIPTDELPSEEEALSMDEIFRGGQGGGGDRPASLLPLFGLLEAF